MENNNVKGYFKGEKYALLLNNPKIQCLRERVKIKFTKIILLIPKRTAK